MQNKLLLWGGLGPYLIFGGYFIYSFKWIGLPCVLLCLLMNITWPKYNLINGARETWHWLVLLIYAYVSSTQTNGPNEVYELTFLSIGVLMLLLIASLDSGGLTIKKILPMVTLMMLIPTIDFYVETFVLGVRMGTQSACFSNPNRYAVFISLMMPFHIYHYLITRKAWMLCLVGLFFSSVLMAGARFAMMSIVGQLIIYFVYAIYSKHGKWVALLLGCCVGLLSLPIFVLILNESGNSILDQVKPYSSVGIRAAMTVDAIGIIKEYWLFGIGTGNVRYEYGYFNKLINPGFGEGVGVIQLHNFFLQLMTTYGVFMFGLITLFFTKMILKSKKLILEKDSRGIIGLMLIMTLPLMLMGPSYVFDYSPFYFSVGLLVLMLKGQNKNFRMKKE